MIKGISKSVALTIFGLSLFSIISCSDQKDQLPEGKGVPNPVINTSPMDEGVSPTEVDDREFIPGNVADRDPNTGFEPREGLDNERDDLTEVNSKKPIIFDGINPNNSGLAGITFKTTLDEASELLSDPTEYSCGFFYDEGMCIEWQKDGTQRPTQIIIVKNYLGEINLPAPIGKIRMGADLTRFFEPGDVVGRSIVENLYRGFFNIDDPTYSCIQDGKCEAREVEDAIIWRLPNIFLQLSKDGGKQVFLILLENKYDPGILTSDFDILNNTFSDGVTKVTLGQAWGDVKKIGEVQDVESIIGVSNFRKDYDGVNAWVYRPDAFSELEIPANYVEPQTNSIAAISLVNAYISPVEATDADIFGGVSLFGSYPGQFKLDNEYIKVNAAGDVFLSPDKNVMAGEFLLRTQVPFLADKYDLQVKILNNLESLMIQKLKSKFTADLKMSVRYDGLEARPSSGKWINFTIYYHGESLPNSSDPSSSTKETGFVFVGMSVRNGYLQVLKEISFDPFLPEVANSFGQEINLLPAPATNVGTTNVPAAVTPVGVVSHVTELQGFKLGEEVWLKEIDWLRKEASFVKADATTNTFKSVKVSFEPRGYIRVSYASNETEILNVWTVAGVSRMSLGLTALDPNPYGANQVKFKISAITSHLNPIGINGLCGFNQLVPRDSSYADVRNLMAAEARKNNVPCAFFGRGNNAEDSEYDQMFFPNQKIKLIFTEKLYTGVTIYE